jgi:pimeloyl-ACP methyl ester carboxylesterase
MWHHFAHPERMTVDDAAYLLRGAAGCDGHLEFMAWGQEHGGVRGLDEIRCPVLLAFPEKDYVLPRKRYGQRVIDALPHAEVVDLPDLGHAAMVDDPERIADLILAFTKRHAQERVAA